MTLSILRLVRRKRGVSPVVAVLFLFAVIIGAIAVSLGIVYPNLQSLNDQINLESTANSFIALNEELISAVQNGGASTISITLENGQRGGLLSIDQVSYSNVSLSAPNGTSSPSYFLLNHSRIQFIQEVDQNPIRQGTHSYLLGGSFQNFFFLNSTLQNSADWTILNQSRPVNSDDVYTSLSYRNIASTETTTNPQKLQINTTIQFQAVNFTVPAGGRTQIGGSTTQLKISYLGPQIVEYPWILYELNLAASANTFLTDPGSTIYTEQFLRAEAPVSAIIDFYVQVRFVFHVFEITILG